MVCLRVPNHNDDQREERAVAPDGNPAHIVLQRRNYGLLARDRAHMRPLDHPVRGQVRGRIEGAVGVRFPLLKHVALTTYVRNRKASVIPAPVVRDQLDLHAADFILCRIVTALLPALLHNVTQGRHLVAEHEAHGHDPEKRKQQRNQNHHEKAQDLPRLAQQAQQAHRRAEHQHNAHGKHCPRCTNRCFLIYDEKPPP